MLQNTENCFSASPVEKPETDLDLKIEPSGAEDKQLDNSGKENMKLEGKESGVPAQQVAPSDSELCLKVVRSQQTSRSRRRSRSRSRSVSASSVSSSCSSSSRSPQSSCSSGSRGHRRQSSRRCGYRRSRSRSWSSSRSRSRPHPRCHRASSHSRCSRRRYRSPPRRYRAHSRSYSRSPTPRWSRMRCRGRSTSRSWSRSRSRSRSRSIGHRLYGFVGRARFISSPCRRSRSRSRSPIGANIHLSIDDKRELLRIAQANAAKALGVETLELPASVKPILAAPEEPLHSKCMRLDGAVLRNTVQQHKERESEEGPSPKMSPRNKLITFSIHNSVAKPTAAGASGSPESPASSRTAGSPYGQWVPIKARSFPVLGHKR
ncbi:arginine/serine-rich protein 1 isoform X1 [Arapaima gigas]